MSSIHLMILMSLRSVLVQMWTLLWHVDAFVARGRMSCWFTCIHNERNVVRVKIQLCFLAKTKRSKASTNYYHNSSATFRPIIQLMHNMELNPGPEVQLNIRCLYINARSLVINKTDELQALTIDVDLLAVTETWLKPTLLDSEILTNSDFTIHRRDRAEFNDKLGGGVLLAVRNNIPSLRSLDLESAAEILACELRPSGKKKVLFVVFYRPPSSDLSYLKEFTKTLRLASRGKFENIVIAGDFNLYLTLTGLILLLLLKTQSTTISSGRL